MPIYKTRKCLHVSLCMGGQGVQVGGYGRLGSTCMWVWEAREYMYVGMGGQGVHVRGYGRAGSTGTWVWEGREYRYVGMRGQGVQVCGRGNANPYLYVGIQRGYITH